MTETLCKCSLFVLVMAYSFGLQAQGGAIPIKQGLWQTTVSATATVSLSADQEAQIAALPAAQQAMIRSRMGGTPTTTTTKSCAATSSSLDTLINDAQQRNTKCTFTNRVQTADGASFDVNCVSPQGTASGHGEFHMSDSEHVTGTMHMTADVTGGSGGTSHMTADNTVTAKYLGTDCGTVKPGAAEVVR